MELGQQRVRAAQAQFYTARALWIYILDDNLLAQEAAPDGHRRNRRKINIVIEPINLR